MAMDVTWSDAGDWFAYSMIPGIGIGMAAYDAVDDMSQKSRLDNARTDTKVAKFKAKSARLNKKSGTKSTDDKQTASLDLGQFVEDALEKGSTYGSAYLDKLLGVDTTPAPATTTTTTPAPWTATDYAVAGLGIALAAGLIYVAVK